MADLTNKRKRVVSMTIEYLDRQFIPALNQVGVHEFDGPMAYSVYRNAKIAEDSLKAFMRRANELIRKYAKSDEKGVLAQVRSEGGQMRPEFMSEQHEKDYQSAYQELYRSTPFKIELVCISEDELAASLAGVKGVTPNALSLLRPMFEDEGDVPLVEADQQKARSNAAPNLTVIRENGESPVQRSSQEPSTDGVLEPTGADQ